jgi:hypothetical protein
MNRLPTPQHETRDRDPERIASDQVVRPQSPLLRIALACADLGPAFRDYALAVAERERVERVIRGE